MDRRHLSGRQTRATIEKAPSGSMCSMAAVSRRVADPLLGGEHVGRRQVAGQLVGHEPRGLRPAGARVHDGANRGYEPSSSGTTARGDLVPPLHQPVRVAAQHRIAASHPRCRSVGSARARLALRLAALINDAGLSVWAPGVARPVPVGTGANRAIPQIVGTTGGACPGVGTIEGQATETRGNAMNSVTVNGVIEAVRAELSGGVTAPEDDVRAGARGLLPERRLAPGGHRPALRRGRGRAGRLAGAGARGELAIRSGGHSLAGSRVSEGGIVLDLSRMRAMEVDADGRTAWAETGLTAGRYTVAAGAHGLATGFGDTGSVGIGDHPGRRSRVPRPQARPHHRRSARGRARHRGR